MHPKEITRFYPENCPMALFLDLDNLTRYDYDFGLLLDALKPWGKLVIRRAYAVHLGSKLKLCEKLHRFDFKILEIGAGTKKNRTDMRMVLEMMDVLHRRPEIKTFVLCSGDGDFLEAIRCLHDNRKAVIGIACKKSCSEALAAACDRFLFLEDLTAGSLPLKHEAVAKQTKIIRTTPEAMRTWLRKCNFLPPDPAGRRRILVRLEEFIPSLMAKPVTLYELQHQVSGQITGFSKTAVRHVLNALDRAGAITLEANEQPRLQRRVIALPPFAAMEEAASRAQLRCLISCPDLVADPVAMAEVIWDAPQRAPEMERLIEAAAGQAVAAV